MIEEPVKYITKVEIQGLWERYDIVWNLHHDVNVLAGINGSGKTTILNCIYKLASKSNESNFFQTDSIDITFNNKEYCKYIKIDENKKKEAYDLVKSHFDKGIIQSSKTDFLEILEKNKEIDSISISPSLNESFKINSIKTFDTELKPQELLQKVDNNTKTELDFELWQLQREYLNYQVNLGKKLKANKGNPDDNSTYFQDKFLEIVDNLFSETNKKVNRDKNELEFLLGDKEINAYQLSSGEKQLLVILLTVLVQDNKPSILLMDEPEISLHIEWQRKLIKYIRELNPNVQIIIATHSPDIIMDGWLDKVFNLQDLIVKDSTVL